MLVAGADRYFLAAGSRLGNWLQFQQEHSESANSAKVKIWFGIQIRISGLIRIRMSVGSLPKCIGFILLSERVILPSSIKSAGDCVRNVKKFPEIPSQRWDESISDPESVSGTGHYQKLINSRGSPLAQLPMPTMFGRRPLPQLWVIPLREQNDKSHYCASLGGIISMLSERDIRG